ncbi:MAG: NUDIX domain-containing protein [Bacteroidales bacterium]|jgi:adenosylhomocysteinase|nr:NUDIX domain-containing protein [Bacteroidales bacterium]
MEKEMETLENIRTYYSHYIKIYKEDKTLCQFQNFIDNTKTKDLFNRKNFVGHITVSAIIIDYDNLKVLLLYHKTLDKWLQPGGHISESDKSILEGTLREVYEETGISEKDLELISPILSKKTLPFIDIDSHYIPQNSLKNEEQHFHHDFRFLFTYKGEKTIGYNEAESKDYKWVDFEELHAEETFCRLIGKIRRLLSFEFRTNLFYVNIISKVNTYNDNYISVVVSHIIPDSVYYLQAINEVFPIQVIVPKPNSIDRKTYKEIETKFKISRITRDNMPTTKANEVVKILKNTTEKIILFDIGGYFADIQRTWPSDILERIMLVIEDTENGHQKYEKKMQEHSYSFKIVAVARSPLKDNEDFLVGQSILFSADAILRQCGTLIQYLKCGVFGYGKIGRSIAFHLQQRGVKPSVYDINPLKRISAFNELNMIPTRENMIKELDVIFSATGNHCLNIEDFRNLKNGCFIFSVTSSDDEMDLKFLKGEYKKEKIRDYIFKYYNQRHFFYLVNNGNAVNFIHDAVMGNFIHLVRGEMILAINNIADYNIGNISEVPTEIKKEIAESWLKVFDPENRKLNNIE